MSQHLILVRHGQTDWNNEFRFQGHTDIKLSPIGREQALALQKRFASNDFEAIYASDLGRAFETAEIIAQPHNLPVMPEPALREINFGAWEGLVFEEVQRLYPQETETWLQRPHLLRVPGAETFASMQERAFQAVLRILACHPLGNILVVTHGGTIAALICAFLKQPLTEMWKYKQKNTAVTVLAVEDKEFKAEKINDTTHLGGL